MFGRNGKAEAVKEAAGKTAPVAVALAQDRKFRKDVADAVRHASVAQRRTARRATLAASAVRLASDEQVRRELMALAANLRSARGRIDKARAGRQSHRGRNLFVLALASGGAALAMPQSRAWLSSRLSSLPFGRRVRAILETIEVEVPVSTAYNQWTQFEEFPLFMEGVEEVRQIDDTTLTWVATVGGKRAEWQAEILEQHPDRQITWVTGEGTRTRGTVSFEPLAPNRTRINLSMSYIAEGPVEVVGSTVGADARRVRGDLQRFKEFIEGRGAETGAWRGDVSAGEAATSETLG